MLLNDHIGELLVALDIHAGCSPCLESIVPDGTVPSEVAKRIEDRIHIILKEELGDFDWTFKPLEVKVNARSGIILSPEEREDQFHAALKPIQDAWAEADKKAEEDEANDPNNGKMGWWRVSGIRHEAIVRAMSAPEARKKALDDGAVQDWECARAAFIADQLPEVVAC